ncbi:unnamed protein product [Bursaphelenchus okinawaensis]|uniref:Palmitoyltransferase n=1 Tax=Bursaphelenchus okinawaensis TaxID=465554 RepID=A0A811KK01_9BILA|nr:unnamed protein product [Bursaphelenchus okinawaensis]CAG9105294.1 unnamed protein product [Bursaphelenchus okinawaensis]
MNFTLKSISRGLTYLISLASKYALAPFLLFIFNLLILIYAYVIYFIYLPYEAFFKPLWLIVVLSVLAVYINLNVVFHYYMARRTPAGSPPISDRTPRCAKCHNHKPENTHHCRICDKCVVGMDHHCVWLNQCVGAGNHRYFIQFLAFLASGTGLFLAFGFRTFLDNGMTNDVAFCDVILEDWAEGICANGHMFVNNCVFFTYIVGVTIFVVSAGMFCVGFVLISHGCTVISAVQRYSVKEKVTWLIWPCKARNFKQNWINFLGSHGGRRFWTHILLPSRHNTYYAEEALQSVVSQC